MYINNNIQYMTTLNKSLLMSGINNYLDLLTDDILTSIIDFATLSIENDIKKVNKKLKLIKNTIKPLRIIGKTNRITYGNIITYTMDNYLYSRMPFEKICVISVCTKGSSDKWISFTHVIKNPIYLDFLRNAYKLFYIDKESSSKYHTNSDKYYDERDEYNEQYDNVEIEGYNVINYTDLKDCYVEPEQNNKYHFVVKYKPLKDVTYLEANY